MSIRLQWKSAILLCLVAALAVPVIAGETSPQSASGGVGVYANLVQPIAVTGTADMNFGSIVPSDGLDGWVVLGTDGSRIADGNSHLGSSAGVSPATFLVSGEVNSTFTLTIPASVALNASDNSGLIFITDINASQSGAIPIANGGTTITVGGRLLLPASRPRVHYAGGITVTATYN